MIASRLRTTKGKATAMGAALLIGVGAFEGYEPVVYFDPVGIPTVCFGSTRGLTKEMVGKVRFTRAECEALLVDELIEHEQGMAKCIKTPSVVPDGVWAASVSFTFNVGVGAFCKSTMARLINSGQYVAACNELPKWVKARKLGVMITWPGLVKRRAKEREMCLEGLPV